jgi:cathepsin L
MMKATLIASLAAVAVASHAQSREYYEKLFFEHVQNFNLQLKDGAEFIHRLEIFASNLDQIEKHNADKTQTYQLGVNQYTHLTFDEFVDSVKLGLKTPFLRRPPSNFVHHAPSDKASLPASVDWVSAGAVTPVKNQGNCGSCWSFSTTGALEGAYYLKYGQLLSFSEQQLVSCDINGGDAGCNGGW